jgi:hypothetical protein
MACDTAGMIRSDADEELTARLARMKQLIDDLERVCAQSNLQSEMREALWLEMNAARRSLKLLAP